LRIRNVAERQKNVCEKLLKDFLNYRFNYKIPVRIIEEYRESLSTGSGMTLITRTENTFLGASALGDIGKTSEEVGEECAKTLISEIQKGGCVDSYMSDQIIPYIAVAKGEVKINELTMHAKTNLYVVNLFKLDVKCEGDLVYCKN